ncbi:MAG: hypothetical protein AAGI01_06415 [Myxococcota bacterium]
MRELHERMISRRDRLEAELVEVRAALTELERPTLKAAQRSVTAAARKPPPPTTPEEFLARKRRRQQEEDAGAPRRARRGERRDQVRTALRVAWASGKTQVSPGDVLRLVRIKWGEDVEEAVAKVLNAYLAQMVKDGELLKLRWGIYGPVSNTTD